MTTSIRDLIRLYNLDPKKSLGQNFLIDEQHLARIVAAAELTPDDTVLEIGPGFGVLTRQLAAQAGRVRGAQRGIRSWNAKLAAAG